MKKVAERSQLSTGSKSSTEADYVSIAIAYAEEAAQDDNADRFCKWIRLAAQRFLRDLERAQADDDPPFLWSPRWANGACRFIECLHHVEGRWETSTITLAPAHVFFVCNLFGFRNKDGSRRFTMALFAVARKNAKSTLAAAIQLACLCLEREEGAQVISAATTGAQARIVWNIAKRMVEKNEDLQVTFGIEPFANAIMRYETGSVYKPINAKASTQDGLNPSCLCLDEVHAHKTRELYDVLRSAAGARSNPLFLYTTTEGYENAGPWSEIRQFAWNVLQGVVEADHFLAVYYGLDDGDDDFDETKWIKANPLLGISVKLEKLREYATEAKTQPGTQAEFKIKRLNRPAASAEAWIDLLRWRKCDGPVVLADMESAKCWAALDLASTRDMTAWRMLWFKDGRWYTWGRYWVPKEAAARRTERGSAPYRQWIDAGYVCETAGNATDYAVVEAQILEDCQRFKPIEVAYDPWNASDIANRLIEKGIPMFQFPQGAKSYSPGFKALEVAYIEGLLNHAGDPVLTWNAANLVPRMDANLNKAPDRKRSADKIDGMACLLMCFARASLYSNEQSFWE